MAMPSQPSFAQAAWKSAGKPPSLSRRSQYSSGKREQSLPIASRMRSCSGVREKSIRLPFPSFPPPRELRDAERDEDERPPVAQQLAQLPPLDEVEVVREEEQPQHDQHDRPDDAVASVCHAASLNGDRPRSSHLGDLGVVEAEPDQDL